jgi:predicted transcriptional regulator
MEQRQMRRRNTITIYYDLLKAVSENCNPTKVMTKALLSWELMTPHLKTLMNLGMVEQKITEIPYSLRTNRVTRKALSNSPKTIKKTEYTVTTKGKNAMIELKKVLEIFGMLNNKTFLRKEMKQK